jgi:hypothetical protein
VSIDEKLPLAVNHSHFTFKMLGAKMTKKTVFGRDIDLSHYEKMWDVNNPKTQEEIKRRYGGRLIKFLFIDLYKKNEDDPEFTNVGVRDDQNTGTSVEDMQSSFLDLGWDITDFPPIVNNDLKFEDGRTRALAAMAEGERYIPAALISMPTKSLKSSLTLGLKANYHKPQRRVTQNDFITAGALAVSKGEINRDETSISEWLNNECDIEKIYPQNAGGSISKIINGIMSRTEKGGTTIIRKKNREDWLQWLSTSPDMVDSEGNRIDPFVQIGNQPEFILYDAPSLTNQARLLARLLENGSKGRHTYIALWSRSDNSPELILKGFKDFVSNTEKNHASIIRYTQSSLNIPGLKITEMNNQKHFTFLGAVPLLMDGNGHEQAYKSHRILPLDQF